MTASRLFDVDESFVRAVDRPLHDAIGVGAEQRGGFMEMTMGMHVDRLDPLAADHHG